MTTRGELTISIALSVLAACGGNPEKQLRGGQRSAALTQTCTAQNVAGYPYSGTVCGGSVIDGCSPGVLYVCSGGARGTTNNCTLSTSCSLACLTGNNSTPVTANTSTPQASDACFTGTAPLTLSSSSITGGNNVTLTFTLNQSHSPYAIVNLNGLNNLVAPPCNVPVELPANVNSLNLTQPTSVITSTTQAPIWTLISYTDASSGRNRNLVSLTTPLTLQPGGSVVVPPLASFSITDASGALISTIAGGGNAFTQGTLSGPAPFGGTKISVTTSPSGAFTTDGSFSIDAACTSNSTWGTLTATSTATSNIAATATASSGAGSPISKNITVTPPPLAIQSVTLNPTSVTGGGSSIATVGLNRAVNAGDPMAAVSLRVSEGNISGAQIATFPGCTGSPACTGTVTVPVGASSAAVTLSTSAVSAQDQLTVAASASWSNRSASANLTINPGACTPKTCAGLGFNCGSASDGCGGTLSCGSCTAPQTCGGGGTPGICGATVAVSSLTLNPSTVVSGNSSVGTVTLNMPAPSGGISPTLSSSNSLVQVPASITIPAGQSSGTFTITTTAFTAGTLQATISASFGDTQNAILTVTASSGCTPTNCAAQGANCGSIPDGCGGTLNCGSCAAPLSCGGGGTPNVCGSTSTVSLASLALNPTSVKGGNSSSGTVTLSGAAPAGGVAVSLSSSNAGVATVPSSVTVAAGATSATFTVSTQKPSLSTTVTISATNAGTTRNASLSVTRR